MSNAKIYYGKIPVGEGKPQVLNVVDNLTSTDPDKPLSANQGYILSQKFMKDVKVTSNNELIITYLNGNTFKYDLSAFLNTVISSIGYGKTVYCDELPKCEDYTDAFGNTQYKITYKKEMLNTLENTENLTILEGMVQDLIVKDNKVSGIILENGEEINKEGLLQEIKTIFNINNLETLSKENLKTEDITEEIPFDLPNNWV